MSNLPDNWDLLPLEKCMAEVIDYRGKTPNKTNTGIPLITAKIVKGGRINEVQEYIDPKDYDSWMRRGLPQAGDIVMTTEAPLGEIAQLDNRKVALAQRLITLRGKIGLLDNNYLKFLMQSYFVQNQLSSRATGTTVLGIKQSELRKISLILPPLPEQKAIASILSSLDDKIELNQQMNQTLEAMARAIFKSWFVDFDPVRAKMAGKQPVGMDAATANLFPDSFEESALGLIPKGWRVGRLDDLLILQRGFDLPKSKRIYGCYPIIAASGFSDNHIEYKVKGPGVTTGRSGVLGNVFYIHNNFWPLNTSLWVKEFRIAKPIYAYHYLRTLELEAFNAGSAVPTLNRNHIHSLSSIIPSKSIIQEFENLINAMFRKRYQNHKKSRTLANIRDTLLPKLMSGEIRVKEAKTIIKEVN